MLANSAPARSCLLAFLVLFALSSVGAAQTSFRFDDPHGDVERLERALTQRGTLSVLEMPLKDVIEKLSHDFAAPMVLSAKKLEEAGVNVDTPVTIHLESMPLESILRVFLKELELDFTVRNSVIMVSTPEDLESPDMMDTRIYPVRDLVARRAAGSTDDPHRWVADYDALLDVIQTTIAPESWVDVGGPGSIMEFDNSGAIIVSQTRTIHREIEQLFAALRRVKEHQGISPLPSVERASTRIAGRAPPAPVRHAAATSAPAWQVPQVYANK